MDPIWVLHPVIQIWLVMLFMQMCQHSYGNWHGHPEVSHSIPCSMLLHEKTKDILNQRRAHYCWEHIGMHFQRGEFIPKGFGIGTFRKYCRTVAESESEEMSSDEMKEESDSESASETW